MKQLILEYLKENGEQLKQDIQATSIKYEPNPSRIVIKTTNDTEIPPIIYQNKQIKVEIILLQNINHAIISEAKNEDALNKWIKRHPAAQIKEEK